MPRSISILGPVFERSSGEPAPACPPATPEAWEDLRSFDAIALRELGLRAFGEVPGGRLYLFPGEWFNAIPDGYEVAKLDGSRWLFERVAASNDIRFGCLAYGLVL